MAYELPATCDLKMEREGVVDSGDTQMGAWLIEGDRIAVVRKIASDHGDDGWLTFRGAFERQLCPAAVSLPDQERSSIEQGVEFRLDVRREQEVPFVKIRK